jgi:hypothetical protein
MKPHTPIPWHEDGAAIAAEDGMEICEVFEQDDEDSRLFQGEGDANSKFIVKAVNCHDELVALLAYVEDHAPEDDSDGDPVEIAITPEALRQIRATLEKARNV